MKKKKIIRKIKKENKIEAIRIITTIGRDDQTICLSQTDIKHNNHNVFMAIKDNYKLFVYKENDNWEIYDQGDCIGRDGLIKQCEIMKILNG